MGDPERFNGSADDFVGGLATHAFSWRPVLSGLAASALMVAF